jgi:polyhydroxyalkanoate synthesis regulator phasin
MPDKRKYARTIRTGPRNSGKEASKDLKKGIMLKDVTDQGVERGGLTQSQKKEIRTDYIRQSQTEKRKGGKGAELRSSTRAGRVAQLRGSATEAMNELSNKEALRKSKTKTKKEDSSPTPFKMLDKSKMQAKATADSSTVFSDKDQEKMGVFNYGMVKE